MSINLSGNKNGQDFKTEKFEKIANTAERVWVQWQTLLLGTSDVELLELFYRDDGYQQPESE